MTLKTRQTMICPPNGLKSEDGRTSGRMKKLAGWLGAAVLWLGASAAFPGALALAQDVSQQDQAGTLATAPSEENSATDDSTIDPAIAEILKTENAADLLRRVDELYRSDASQGRMRMQIVTPNWERTMEMQIWTQGMEKTFIRILAPKKDRGVATLKVGDEMWNYLPKIGREIKVSPSMMMSSWMGSDFTNDDLVKEASLADDYIVEREDGEGTIRMTLTPKEQTVTVWAKIDVVVDMRTLLPVEQTYWNDRGEKVRVLRFLETRDFGGRTLPSKLEMVPLTESKAGNRTIIYYDELNLDVEIDDAIFTKRNLKAPFD